METEKQKYRIALAGNPNCGKTTLFNALTGSNQRTGNWPGVTVDIKEGNYNFAGAEFEVVDLPGIYSFSAHSLDEKIAREFILRKKPDIVVNVLDATNLERNLYLTTQIIEMKRPVIVVLNMCDMAERRGVKIDDAHLARHLDCHIIRTVANKNKGIEELKTAILNAIKERRTSSARVNYDPLVENALAKISACVRETAEKEGVDSRWLSIKLLENDSIGNDICRGRFDEVVASEAAKILKHVGNEAEFAVIDGRYGFIHGISKDVVSRDFALRKTFSDMIDNVALSKALGLPIFLFVMFVVFAITMDISRPFSDFLENLIGALLVDGTALLLEIAGVPVWLNSIISDGIGGGIQTVASFVPSIALIFLCLSFLEDSGYVARGAFLMDRLCRAVGLPGKAFIPMLVGFGCTVPAIMSARTIENRRDRIITILVCPFISCGARLPVYAAFISVFFRNKAGLILFSLYFTGIVLALGSSLLFRKTLFKEDAGELVMELPPYHMPTLNGMLFHTWHRLKDFVLRAGKTILISVVIIRVFSSVESLIDSSPDNASLIEKAGRITQPIFAPMGIQKENWPASIALATGILAKEAVLGTLISLYSQQNQSNEVHPFQPSRNKRLEAIVEQLKAAFQSINPFNIAQLKSFDPIGISEAVGDVKSENHENGDTAPRRLFLHYFNSRSSAFAFLLFVLVYTPCIATVVAVQKEIGTKWAFFSVIYQTALAWITATAFYQIANFWFSPISSIFWLLACITALLIVYLILKNGILRYDEAKGS